ncbi:MAG: hypothetical protein WKF30_10875 [Pyrinomonadaceae bacterium]
MKNSQAKLWMILAAVVLLASAGLGCGDKASESTGDSVQTKENPTLSAAQSNSTAPITVGAESSGGMGDPVDTSKFNAEISRLERLAEKNPGDEPGRRALANAYLMRANALTGVRQYRAALGDYRHVLRYDPDNEEAQAMAATIINIMNTMGREVPAEGDEPAPLQVTPETMPDDTTTLSDAHNYNQKNPSKKPKQ